MFSFDILKISFCDKCRPKEIPDKVLINASFSFNEGKIISHCNFCETSLTRTLEEVQE